MRSVEGFDVEGSCKDDFLPLPFPFPFPFLDAFHSHSGILIPISASMARLLTSLSLSSAEVDQVCDCYRMFYPTLFLSMSPMAVGKKIFQSSLGKKSHGNEIMFTPEVDPSLSRLFLSSRRSALSLEMSCLALFRGLKSSLTLVDDVEGFWPSSSDSSLDGLDGALAFVANGSLLLFDFFRMGLNRPR